MMNARVGVGSVASMLGLAAACSGEVLVDSEPRAAANASSSSASTAGGGSVASATGDAASTTGTVGAGGAGGDGGAGGSSLTCPDGEAVCGGACVDTMTSLAHCGACGNGCPAVAGATSTCSAGQCGFACNPGQDDCNADPTDGCEQELSSDPQHCGACLNVCPNKQACVSGACDPKSCLGQLGFKPATENFSTKYASLFGITAGDLDGDGKPEIVGVSYQTMVLPNLGNGAFGPPYSLNPKVKGAADPKGLVLADLNGDGRLDVVFGNYDSYNVVVGIAQGDGTYAATSYKAMLPMSVTTGDFDGDGDIDFANARGTGFAMEKSGFEVRLNDGNGAFGAALAPSDLPKYCTYSTVQAGDFNGDGKADVALYGGNKFFSVFLATTGGAFAPRIDVPTAEASTSFTGPKSLDLGDFDGDGHLDLVAGSYYGLVVLYLGDGNGGFKAKTTLTNPASTDKFTVGDFDGDGRRDLALLLWQAPHRVSVFRGKGDGTFEPELVVPIPVTIPIAPSEPEIGAADLDGDGKDDLFVSSDVVQKVPLLYGTSVWTFPGACL